MGYSLLTCAFPVQVRKRGEVAGTPSACLSQGTTWAWNGGSQSIIIEGTSRVRFLHHFLWLLQENLLNLTLDGLQSEKGPSNWENRFRMRSEIRGLRPSRCESKPSFSLTPLITRPAALFTFTKFWEAGAVEGFILRTQRSAYIFPTLCFRLQYYQFKKTTQ